MKIGIYGSLLLAFLAISPNRVWSGDCCSPAVDCCSACGDCSTNTCDDSCGTPCGRGACRDRTACGPLTFVFSIFDCNSWRGPVCGERYWGDFYSDPPACHDPCDNCGNYVGRSASRGEWGNVRGYSSGSIGGGCSSCNKNRVYDDQPIPQESRVVSPSVRVTRQPTPAKQQIKAAKPH